MIEIGIVVLLLIGVLVFFKVRKKKLTNITPQASNESKKSVVEEKATVNAKVPVVEQTTSAVETKPVDTVTPVPTAKVVVNVQNEKPVKVHTLLPEDSALKRHHVTQLQAMAIAVRGSCPSDATLRRHYLTDIAMEVECCLNDKVALERLMHDYHQTKKSIIVEPVALEPVVMVESEVIAEPEPIVVSTEETHEACKCSKIPEDSTLKRHYLTQIKAQAIENLPPCPTDSTLRRHYHSLLDSEIARLSA